MSVDFPTTLEVSIEQALYKYLISFGICGGRIYPHKLPANVGLPAIAYSMVNQPSNLTHTGPSTYALSRMQLSIMAKTYSDNLLICQQLRAVLEGMSGIWSGIQVFVVTIDSEMDGEEPLDTTLHRRLMELTLEHAATGGN